MKFKKIKVNLLVKILVAIGLGIACGNIMPGWFGSLSATFNGLFSQFLNFLIPLIILGFVAPAIADIGKGAGKCCSLQRASLTAPRRFPGYTVSE